MLLVGWRGHLAGGRYVAGLAAAGWVAVLAMAALGVYTLVEQVPLLFA
jgi:hypothetical protein